MLTFAPLWNRRDSSDEETRRLSGAIGRLTIEVRTVQTVQPPDLLKLASWFTRETQPVDADDIFGKLEAYPPLNDLEYHFWQTPEQLYAQLFDLFQIHFGLKSADDYKGFNRALGLNGGSESSVEQFQILSLVRMEPHGVYAVNRLIQKQYRGRLTRSPLLGDEKISLYDKVIQFRNQERSPYSAPGSKQEKTDISNGEIGLVTNTNGPLHNLFRSQTMHKSPCQWTDSKVIGSASASR